MLAHFCLVANCPSFNDNKPYHPLCHSPWPYLPLSTRNNKQEFPSACMSTGFRNPCAALLWKFWHNLPYRRPVELVRLELLGRESRSASTTPRERWGLLRGLHDISRHSKAVFGAPSCGRSRSALPTSLASASNNSNNYSGTPSRCTRIRGR